MIKFPVPKAAAVNPTLPLCLVALGLILQVPSLGAAHQCLDQLRSTDSSRALAPLRSQALESSGTIFGRLPEDLKGPVLRSLQSKIQSGSQYGLSAYYTLRFLGQSEQEANQIAREQLLRKVDIGRRMELSRPLQNPLALESRLPEIQGPQRAFYDRYELAAISETQKQLGLPSLAERLSTYAVSLSGSFSLARASQNHDLAMEMFIHMLRLRSYRDMTDAAASFPNADLIRYRVALLAISDFYHIRSLASHFDDAINALQRIQGPLRPQAEVLLTDLAKAILDPSFPSTIKAAPSERLALSKGAQLGSPLERASYALRLLRAAGRVTGAVALDSVRVDFATEVTDPARIQLIQKTADFVHTNRIRPTGSHYDEVFQALVSIRDIERLEKISRDALAKSKSAEPSEATILLDASFNYAEAAGNRILMREALSEQARRLEDHNSNAVYRDVLPAAIRLNDLEVLTRIETYARDLESGRKVHPWNGWESRDIKKIVSILERVRAGQSVEEELAEISRTMPLPRPYTLQNATHEAIALERQAIEEIAKFRADLTGSKQKALLKEVQTLEAAGHLWDAWRAAAAALDREALVRIGEKMTARGDGLNAIEPLIYAAVLAR